MTDLSRCSLTVVGLGLMGGSLAGALRGKCRQVFGVDRHPSAVDDAFKLGLVDQSSTDLTIGITAADIVILATPVRTILALLDEIAPHLKPGCLVMDLGSTKQEIVNKMAGLPEGVQPLGGHPMCGKETSGIRSADTSLFKNTTFVLAPLERTGASALRTARLLAQAAGANPLVMDAETHDRIVAVTSHLPYLAAGSLTAVYANAAARDSLASKVAASGFRDTSRLAASDLNMMVDILLTNRSSILKTLNDYQTYLGILSQLIENEDEEGLRTRLSIIRQTRSRMFQ